MFCKGLQRRTYVCLKGEDKVYHYKNKLHLLSNGTSTSDSFLWERENSKKIYTMCIMYVWLKLCTQISIDSQRESTGYNGGQQILWKLY
jgi:hypothetical protein